jgi:N-acetylmuramoyl-L-alanine amidase
MKKFSSYKILSLVLIIVLSVTSIRSINVSNRNSTEVQALETIHATKAVLTDNVDHTSVKLLAFNNTRTNDFINRINPTPAVLFEDFSINKNSDLLTDNESTEIIEDGLDKSEEVKSDKTEKKEPDKVNKNEVKKQSESPTPQVDINDFSENDIYEWAKIVHCEARGESQLCREYIAQVVLNRYLSNRYPNTIHGVIFQSNQFSPTFDGSWERLEPNQAAYDAVYSVINSSEPLTPALFFEACRGESWHSRNLTEVDAVDNTRFYI